MKENELQTRLFDFTVRVLKFLPTLPKTPEFNVIRYQLAKCSTSAGANYEESQAGSSKADFNNKVRISLKEMRESNYWLRIISAIINEKNHDEELAYLCGESNELKKILGSIVFKTSK
ncbi:four helix bundle protein [Melioribacteraceae bacterium 4301-Me]|uniref:four helix bundle protein n=1 Tax=Pyranulibacter aquaticus TaxID=3163344 RepID=UPI003599DF71